MPNKKSKTKIPVSVMVALIAGLFGVLSAVIAIVPDLIFVQKDDKTESEDGDIEPTWPPLPLANLPSYSNPTSEIILISNVSASAEDILFDDNFTAAEASSLEFQYSLFPTTNDVSINFDVTNISTENWMKIENQLYVRVNKVEPVTINDRFNLIKGARGGPGYYADFQLFVDGNIRATDVLITPPADDADYYLLQPGEIQSMRLQTRWNIPHGQYDITLGLVVSIKDNKYLYWVKNPIKLYSPKDPIVWEFKNGQWVSSSP